MLNLLRQLRTATGSWLDAGFNFLYPPICQICRVQRATAAEGYVCLSCWSGRGGVRFVTAPFCSCCGLMFPGDVSTAFECSNCRDLELHFRYARSSVVASGLVLDVIHRYKYQQQFWFEPFLADLLVRQAAPVLRAEAWDWLVPVPLYPVKQREREFNQAERLARHLAAATGLPVKTRLLRRVQPTRTQTQLTREQRAANVRGAFALCHGREPDGKRIVLLDDVFTTGATTNACAKILRDAGAVDVCVWTLARGV